MLARMRTQAEVMKHIKETDPESNLTAHALRALVLSGRIPSVEVGRKRLINLDKLDEYLANIAEQNIKTQIENYGQIRPIEI